jgi:hypothetical protein
MASSHKHVAKPSSRDRPNTIPHVKQGYKVLNGMDSLHGPRLTHVAVLKSKKIFKKIRTRGKPEATRGP